MSLYDVSAEVVVLGGGISGCAAAVACRTAGLSVIMVEATQALGGVVVRGDHRTLCGLAPLDAESPELLEPMYTDKWLSYIAAGQPFRQGRVWLWPTTGQVCAAGLQRALHDYDVTVHKGEVINAINTSAEKIEFLSSTKGQRYVPRAIIDASGSGVVHQLVKKSCQPAVQWPAIRCTLRLPISPNNKMQRVRALGRIQELLQVHAAVALTPIDNDNWQLSCDIPPHKSVADYAPILEHIARELSGELLTISTTTAVRDAGRPASRITVAQLFAQRERGLCWAAWPQELHTENGVEWLWPHTDRHGIPEFIVRDADELPQVWTIGKGMAVSAEAASALRVTGTCLALGGAIAHGIKNYVRARA
jgi:FAD dependent oxidoreductase